MRSFASLTSVLYVAIGAAVGGVARYLVTVAVQTRLGPGFPVATLLINISGSLLLGFIAAYTGDSTSVTPELRLLLTTGVCGGYTTFSTFSYDAMKLLEDGSYNRAALYIVLSVALSVGGVFLGFAAGRSLIHLQRGT